jgi:ABC-type transport system involved in multi-copper enzyme maturation permease subunit
MFSEIFAFELRQQLKSPLFWMIALAFAAFAFAAAASDASSMGGGTGNVHRNAPLVVINLLGLFTALALFLAARFVAGAALRDFEAGTAELFFAMPVPRASYLGGRLAAGYVAALIVMLVVALGLLSGAAMPWVDPERLGPTSFAAYGWSFAVVVLPDLLFISALLFLLATLTRSMLSVYVGIIAFVVLQGIAGQTLGGLEYRTLGAMIDPFGSDAIELATRYWSAQDRNTHVPDLTGVLLANRAVWSAASVALLLATFTLFRPDREGLRLGWRWQWWRKDKVGAKAAATTAIHAPAVHLHAGARARATQFVHLARFDMLHVLSGMTFLVLLAFGLLTLGVALAFANEIYGTKVYPVTHLMTRTMASSYGFLIIVIVFYAGELVWRERSVKISDVTDAFPLPDFIPLLSKLAALAAVIVLFLLAGAAECVVYQLWHGYTHIEPSLYLSDIALDMPRFLLLAALALFLQAIANNKFLGYLLFLIYFGSEIALSQLDYNHNLYHYGFGPGVPYSDMNGYGHFLTGHLWFRAYWTFLAIALLTIAALYRTRGVVQGWKERTRIAMQRFGTSARAWLAVSMAAFIASGIWIFYNTNVLHTYVPADLARQRQADYEKLYRQYKDLPQPKITDIKIDMDLYPHERRFEARGHYVIANRTDQPISDLHVRMRADVTLVKADFAPHDVVSDDWEHDYTIYRLKEPLAPGASMDFDFTVHYGSVGFRNTADYTDVVDNGTFINNSVFPHFGYDEGGQLQDRNDRRKYGLPPQLPRIARIDDAAARQFNLMGRDADWVNFETTVSTVPDQIAIAPGYLEKEWTEDTPERGRRRYFQYKMDKPILDFFSFQSARYAVRRDAWNGVTIEIYYNHDHAFNVDRMIEVSKRSLAHYSAVYSPYQFRQLRIIEFPRYQSFAQSFANTIPYSESVGFIADLRNPDDIDYVSFFVAHEIGHQWWAHQVIGANVQGVTMLDETFAQYSALMVMESVYGAQKIRKFLKYELDRYLSARGGEVVEENPLALVEGQAYIRYEKGSVVMYALKDYLGEELVDETLARFVRDKAFQQPPYTTTAEFLDYLRQSAGPQWNGLISDLFEKITLFDNRVIEATAKKRADGKYDVTIKVHTNKVYADGVGKETPATVDLPIDIAVFARAPDGKEDDEKVLYFEKRKVDDGDSTITVTVDGEPFEAGIDPYNKLVDRVSSDNRKRVTLD